MLASGLCIPFSSFEGRYIPFLSYFFFLDWKFIILYPVLHGKISGGLNAILILLMMNNEFPGHWHNCRLLFSDHMWSWIKMCDWKYIVILWSVISDPHLFFFKSKNLCEYLTFCGSADQHLHAMNLINKHKSVRMRKIN